MTQDLSRLLLDWYDIHHRQLPWRITPPMAAGGLKADPYHIWLSEVMLQQTTVQAVKPYFEKFITRWPTVNHLAQADTEEVMAAWAGLGYYARARNLKKCAETVALHHNGRFPDHVEGLLNLPGIGDYTSAAIAAIAFNRQAAVVDGNVERVITRLYAILTPLPMAKPEIKAKVAAITPENRPGDFAQAMMDLGATICTPKRPACALCPFNSHCLALKSSEPELFPYKASKKARPIRLGAAFIALNDAGQILLRKRIEKGLLGGMSEVPTTDWTARLDGENTIKAAPFAANWQEKGKITHVFTHFELHLSVYLAQDVAQGYAKHGEWWAETQNLANEALPTVMKKAIVAALPHANFKRNAA